MSKFSQMKVPSVKSPAKNQTWQWKIMEHLHLQMILPLRPFIVDFPSPRYGRVTKQTRQESSQHHLIVWACNPCKTCSLSLLSFEGRPVFLSRYPISRLASLWKILEEQYSCMHNACSMSLFVAKDWFSVKSRVFC